MQKAIHQQALPFQNQANYLPGHGTGIEADAANDQSYEVAPSRIKLVLSVLANVIGGALLLSAMFLIPQIIAIVFA
jgi:hypothetical protein